MPGPMTSVAAPLVARAELAATSQRAGTKRSEVGLQGDAKHHAESGHQHPCHVQELNAQQPQRGRCGDAEEQDRANDVRTDQQRSAAEPVDPDAGYQTDHDARHILGCAQRSHLARGGVQDERSSQRQGKVADL
jgi:hypothetical protein